MDARKERSLPGLAEGEVTVSCSLVSRHEEMWSLLVLLFLKACVCFTLKLSKPLKPGSAPPSSPAPGGPCWMVAVPVESTSKLSRLLHELVRRRAARSP